MNGSGNSGIGLVIVAHGALADALMHATEHVVGPMDGLQAVAIGPNDDLRICQNRIEAAVADVRAGSGVIVVTDMFGGTPSNLAISVMNDSNIEVIAGVNLPMLIKLASIRAERGLGEAVDAAKEAGRKYISVASQVLTGDS